MNRILIMIASVLVLSLHPLAAQPPAGAGGPEHALPARIAAYLELTQDQIDAAQQLRQELRTKVEPLHQQQKDLRDQLRDELDSDSPDAAAVGQLVIDERAVGEQIRAAVEASRGAFEALLTPEQLVRWEALSGGC